MMPFSSEQKIALMFSSFWGVYAPLRCVCRGTRMPGGHTVELITKPLIVLVRLMHWLKNTVEKIVTVTIAGGVVIITFPQASTMPTTTGVWHGTSLWAAYSIWHRGFKIGSHGHRKNKRHVNGIWGMLTFKECLRRAATSQSYQPLCTQCKEGDFDAWSTPVGIKFLALQGEVTTIPGIPAVCQEKLGDVELCTGRTIQLQDRICSIQFEITTYTLYRDQLGDQLIRDRIAKGDLIMCSAKWCNIAMTKEQLASALVCPIVNPCGKVIAASRSSSWIKTNSKRYFCHECFHSAFVNWQ
jgi:hypothetical protein